MDLLLMSIGQGQHDIASVGQRDERASIVKRDYYGEFGRPGHDTRPSL